MTTIGTIITTHTGPARVVVMVPGGTRPDGQDYNQALTQAVANGSVAAAGAPVSAAQQGDNGQNSPATTAPAPSPVTSQPAMQAVFVLDPHAITASPDSSSSSGDQSGKDGTDGQQTRTKDQTRSADGSTGPDGKTHWQPSGLAKITALYRTTEKLTASEGGDAATGDHLSILG